MFVLTSNVHSVIGQVTPAASQSVTSFCHFNFAEKTAKQKQNNTLCIQPLCKAKGIINNQSNKMLKS